MGNSQDPFCWNCGNLRVVGMGVCPYCGNSYDEPYTGPLGSAQGPTLLTPTEVAPRPTQPIWNNSLSPGQPTLVSPPPEEYAPVGSPIQPMPGKTFPWGKLVIGQSIALLLLVVVILAFLFHSFTGTNPSLSNPPNSSPAPGSTVSGTKPTATPATITKNVQLKCGGCNDPVLVTITTITIGTTKMVWGIELQNQTKAIFSGRLQDFTLIDPTGQKTPGVLDSGGLVELGGASPSSGYDSATFSFVPYTGETYNLTVNLEGSDLNNHFYQIQFDPASFTF